MNDLPINLWPDDVIERLKAWDGIIPPAAGMTLRCPLGPKACNAQWVIGNIADVIFVDAVTGEISESISNLPLYFFSDEGFDDLRNRISDYKVCIYFFEASCDEELDGRDWLMTRTIENRKLIFEVCSALDLLTEKPHDIVFDYGWQGGLNG